MSQRQDLPQPATGDPSAPVTKYTAGPWYVGPHYRTDVESRHGRICECLPMNAPSSITNARLIAAAPELLEALKALRARCDYADLREIADSAIAKAEGK